MNNSITINMSTDQKEKLVKLYQSAQAAGGNFNGLSDFCRQLLREAVDQREKCDEPWNVPPVPKHGAH